MIEITIWLLVAVSNGSYNMGTSTVIDRFSSNETCEEVRKQMYEGEPKIANSRWAKCLKATVLREKQG